MTPSNPSTARLTNSSRGGRSPKRYTTSGTCSTSRRKRVPRPARGVRTEGPAPRAGRASQRRVCGSLRCGHPRWHSPYCGTSASSTRQAGCLSSGQTDAGACHIHGCSRRGRACPRRQIHRRYATRVIDPPAHAGRRPESALASWPGRSAAWDPVGTPALGSTDGTTARSTHWKQILGGSWVRRISPVAALSGPGIRPVVARALDPSVAVWVLLLPTPPMRPTSAAAPDQWPVARSSYGDPPAIERRARSREHRRASRV